MSPLSRRRFLRGSLALAGASLLVGCAGYSPLGPAAPPTPPPIPRIGLLGLGQMASYRSFDLQQRLAELGYIEGETIVTERRNLSGAGAKDRLDALAVEQPSQFDFAINQHTAQVLGLTIPQTVLLQATELN